MPNLTAAHRGYEYQDLMSACRLVDLVLGHLREVLIEERLVAGDRFDDLTTVDSRGFSERIQIKHADDNDRRLAVSTFANDSRRLRLDHLFASILAHRPTAQEEREESEMIFRVVLRDGPPIDDHISPILAASANDPGPFIEDLGTRRYSFDPQALWRLNREVSHNHNGNDSGFSSLRDSIQPFTIEELTWACGKLYVEANAPPSSGDLSNPDIAEQLFLRRIRKEIGAEQFPNRSRSAIDVGAALIGIVRLARQKRIVITRAEILSKAQLRSDFGAVTRAHPVDRALEVPRESVARFVAQKAASVADHGGLLTIVGAPGHGKSWLCQQMLRHFCSQKWLVAEHYCYLGDADTQKTERVLSERVFGSLVSRLVEADPELESSLIPRFAANIGALERLLDQSRSQAPDRRIALIVDGLDHVTRVLTHGPRRSDPSSGLAQSLAELSLPPGTVMILLTQPGPHVTPLIEAGAQELEIAGFNEGEIAALATRFDIVPQQRDFRSYGDHDANTSPQLDDAIVNAIALRSGGNALYATYLCREIKKHGKSHFDPIRLIEELPQYDGSLEIYYQHLTSSLQPEGGWVADVLALVDFALSKSDIKAIRPDASHRVGESLLQLEPVLLFRATQGGYLIYHESFARYLRQAFDNEESAAIALSNLIAQWLETKGLFEDGRAFQSLFRLMSLANRHEDVVRMVGDDFVANALASSFPVSAINKNLATAIHCASNVDDWPSIVRSIELSRSAESYQYGQFDSALTDFADVPIALLGAETVAARLVHEGATVLPARIGLHLCDVLDQSGAVAPWLQYMRAYVRESESDNTVYGRQSDIVISTAWLRGRLRLASTTESEMPTEPSLDPLAPFSWQSLSEQVGPDQIPVQEVVPVILDTCGIDGIQELMSLIEEKGELCLAVARYLAREPGGIGVQDPVTWAIQAVEHGIPPGEIHEVIKLGIPINRITKIPVDADSDHLLTLTLQVQHLPTAIEIDTVNQWLDECTLAAHCDPTSLNSAEAVITGQGWHKCWIRYAISIMRAEAANGNQEELAEIAFQHLTGDLRPFAGQPRACDLSGIEDAIESTLRRGLDLVSGAALDRTIRLINQVSHAITTSLRGMVGGPLRPQLVMQLAADAHLRTGSQEAREILRAEISELSSGRLYAEIAEMHLRQARFALSTGNYDDAKRSWKVATELLAGYGFRKDITVFELLDPLPALIKADRSRARELLKAARPLYMRVVNHTDGSETNWAPTVWWKSLSIADPIALARLAGSQLLTACNDPNDLLHGALTELWRNWHSEADPRIAAALRLAIDPALETSDADHLSQFLENVPQGGTGDRQFATQLLARVDERAVTYDFSNGQEILDRDDQIVNKLNAVANAFGLPRVNVVHAFRQPRSEPTRRYQNPPTNGNQKLHMPDFEMPLFDVGRRGTRQAIRAWSQRPHKPQGIGWEVGRFANAIGYRLTELVQDGKSEEAHAALGLLSEIARFGERSAIWLHLAEGFEWRELNNLASLAYTIPWVQARREGGSTHIDNLERAMNIDPHTSTECLIDEIQRMVLGSNGPYDSWGLTKSLVHGFSTGALNTIGRQCVDTAFDCWNAAFGVIAKRAPRINESDDPAIEYEPIESSQGVIDQTHIDEAFALGIVASLAHPSREKKRRSMLAIRVLIKHNPGLAGIAIDFALKRLECAATSTWLLTSLENCQGPTSEAIAKCEPSLKLLSSSQYFAVREKARLLIESMAAPISVGLTPVDPVYLDRESDDLWPESTFDSEDFIAANGLANSVAGQRIRGCEGAMPNLGRSVARRVAIALRDQRARDRIRDLSRNITSQSSERIPDTFDVLHETAENQLQLVATRHIQSRHPYSAGEQLELTGLISILQNDPTLALDFESKRIPRPAANSMPPIELAWVGSDLSKESSPINRVWDISEASEAHESERKHWRFLAAFERIHVHRWHLGSNQVFNSFTCRAIEIRSADDTSGFDTLPLAQGHLSHWFVDLQGVPMAPSHFGARPLFGIECDPHDPSDGFTCLAGRQFLVTPTPLICSILGLMPSTSFALRDDKGDAIQLVHWRAAYKVSRYELDWPQLVGCGVLVRPDLCQKLLSLAAEDLILRDYTCTDMNDSAVA